MLNANYIEIETELTKSANNCRVTHYGLRLSGYEFEPPISYPNSIIHGNNCVEVNVNVHAKDK